MRNIEIKARLHERRRVERELERLGARDEGIETQHDVFFHCHSGRLKLRDSSRSGATLIHYERPDSPTVRPSAYELAAQPEGASLLRVLEGALGKSGEVRKRRHLYLLDNIRVHLDEVEGLGHFLELEAVVDAVHPADDCERAVESLLERFGITKEDLIATAYVDLDRRPDP